MQGVRATIYLMTVSLKSQQINKNNNNNHSPEKTRTNATKHKLLKFTP